MASLSVRLAYVAFASHRLLRRRRAHSYRNRSRALYQRAFLDRLLVAEQLVRRARFRSRLHDGGLVFLRAVRAADGGTRRYAPSRELRRKRGEISEGSRRHARYRLHFQRYFRRRRRGVADERRRADRNRGKISGTEEPFPSGRGERFPDDHRGIRRFQIQFVSLYENERSCQT